MKRDEITGNEVFFDKNTFIVSKTDLHGKIVQVNHTLLAVTGYSKDELIGKQHNILRHAHMPRGFFELMWETLKAGNEFYGFMKNRCKNGDHYWVFAYVRPETDASGKIIGYRSFRRAAARDMVDLWEKNYEQMRALEEKRDVREQCAASRDWLEKWVRKEGAPDYAAWVLRHV